jgi:hypothetical protein
MNSRVTRLAAPAKKLVYTTAVGSLVFAYVQQCKNDVLFYTKSK